MKLRQVWWGGGHTVEALVGQNHVCYGVRRLSRMGVFLCRTCSKSQWTLLTR